MCIAISSSILILILDQISLFLSKKNVILNLSKGFDRSTGSTLEKKFLEKLGNNVLFAVGSGPNFASKIISEDISSMTIAIKSKKVFEVYKSLIKNLLDGFLLKMNKK